MFIFNNLKFDIHFGKELDAMMRWWSEKNLGCTGLYFDVYLKREGQGYGFLRLLMLLRVEN